MIGTEARPFVRGYFLRGRASSRNVSFDGIELILLNEVLKTEFFSFTRPPT